MFRWKLPLLVFVLLMMVALPFTAAANGGGVITEPLDFTLDSEDDLYPGASGEGWTWDAASKTLTLSGINVDINDEYFAINLPDGAGVVLAGGTNNGISNIAGIGILCCDGSLNISGGGNLSLDTYRHGIRAYDNLTIDMTGKLNISSESDHDGTALRVGNYGDGGDLVIRNCNTFTAARDSNIAIRVNGDVIISGCHEVSISNESWNAIRVDGDVSISDCHQVLISNESDSGIRNFGKVNLADCSQVAISGYYNGIRCDGDVVIANCPDIEISAACEEADYYQDYQGHGIYASGGSVTVNNSALTVYGPGYGIATGPICDADGTGGDIVINHSFVDVSCSENGYAAIFAGDDLLFGGEGEHAKIVLNGCTITAPAGCRVLDVNIESACQTVTVLAEIEEITDWAQVAKAVVIKPLYTLTYDANSGSGTMTDAKSPYAAGSAVTVPVCTFTAPVNKTFSGWNTAANGSGTAYAPGATFVLTGNTVLYAQYTSASFTLTFDSQGGSATATLTVPGDSIATAPAAPTRKGYTFGGWYKDAECKNAWNFATDKVTGNVTLYAKWIPSGQLPATSGQSAAPAASILAVCCLLGGLLLLTICKRRKEYV